MHPRAAEFAACARERFDLEVDIHEFPEGTKTAADAAAVIGCDLAQIASGIVLAADQLVVVVTSGANRVSHDRVATLRGVDRGTVTLADPDPVRQTLGWSIGGVPPFCHATAVPVYLDETLRGFEEVWAAAGTPNAVFPIAPDRLVTAADAEVTAVAE